MVSGAAGGYQFSLILAGLTSDPDRRGVKISMPDRLISAPKPLLTKKKGGGMLTNDGAFWVPKKIQMHKVMVIWSAFEN